MTTGIAVFTVGILVVVVLILVGAAVLDRARARRVESDVPDRVDAADDLEERKAHHHGREV